MIAKYATITSKHTREALVLMDNNDSLPQYFAHEHIHISLSQQILICKTMLVSVYQINFVV